MKVHDRYRFTLQWGFDSEEKIRAGDFLDCLGNRKSEIVVLALTEYLDAHPQVINAGKGLKIVAKQSFTKEQLKAIVMSIIEEKFSQNGVVANSNANDNKTVVEDSDIDEMLKNLELF